MKCDHKRIKSVNCHYFCIDCGEELPEAAVFAQKPAKNPDGDHSAGKTTGRKRNDKNAEKNGLNKYDPPNLEGRSSKMRSNV